jgi:DNA-binding MltR family transcriptional regulator
MQERAPEVDHLGKALSSLNAESDRGMVLVGAAIIEERLADILISFLADNDSKEKVIGRPDAPLGTYSAKLNMAHALGLIDDSERNEMDLIRRIRNEFAHKWDSVGFETDKIRDLAKQLPWRGPGEFEAGSSAKSRFQGAVSMLIVDLMWRSRLVVNEKRIVKSWPNTAR